MSGAPRSAATRDGGIRVLVVDDSAIARELIGRGLSLDPGIEVVGKAADAFAARDKIVFLSPDVVTLDVEMPRMDGIEFLKRLLPQYPVPVVIVSGVTAEGSRRALEALEAGAVAVVAKPSSADRAGLETMIEALREAVREAAKADLGKMNRLDSATLRTVGSAGGAKERRSAPPGWTPSPGDPLGPESRGGLVAIGASTGGTVALGRVIPEFPSDMPPVVVVQHMPPVFTRMFAESLSKVSRVRVKEAEEGDRLEKGLVLVAPGDRHLRVEKSPLGLVARLDSGPKVSGHRPSVDVLFESVAALGRQGTAALLLTGMGKDGAAGMLALRRAGATCLAQDEASSVVFGMPKEAWENGGAERLVGIERAARELVDCFRRGVPAGAAGDGSRSGWRR